MDVCRYWNTEFPGESEGDVHCHGFGVARGLKRRV
ncbi:unnamed protein product [Ectocarpus fasciculatus]